VKRLTCSLGGAAFAFLLLSLVPSALGAGVDKAPATISLMVPADAVVEIAGKKSTQSGVKREFVTPDLDSGKKFYYELKVTYTLDGKMVEINDIVIVEAGKPTVLDLTKGAPVAKAEPKEIKAVEKKDEPKKEEPKKEVRLDVVYVPTPEPVVEAMLKLAEVTEKDVVYDLGCGDGRIVITAVKKFKAKKGLGVELAPERVKLSKENAVKEGVDKQVEIREGSVFDLKDVSEASVVTLYLLPELNDKLMPLLTKTLKPGSRVVSHDFPMSNWTPEKEIRVKGPDREHTVYLWRIPDAKKEEKKDEKKPQSRHFVPSGLFLAFNADGKNLDVPYVPTPEPVVEAMLKLANVTEKDVVYDLGCGDGRIVISAVKKFKAKKGLGIELAPERVKLSKENAEKAGVEKLVEIREGSVLDLKDVSEASVVTLYLLPSINEKLKPMLRKTLKPGSRVVSHQFEMGDDWPPEKTIEVQGNGTHKVHLWTIPQPK
jgi:uncharacterized protein (TIGR03000 family)